MRFFVYDNPHGENELRASHLTIDYSDDFLTFLDFEEIPDPRIESIVHGYDFGDDMFEGTQEIDLEFSRISKFHVDKDQNFAGVTILDGNLKETVIQAQNLEGIISTQIDGRIINEPDTTILIGFRTSKPC